MITFNPAQTIPRVQKNLKASIIYSGPNILLDGKAPNIKDKSIRVAFENNKIMFWQKTSNLFKLLFKKNSYEQTTWNKLNMGKNAFITVLDKESPKNGNLYAQTYKTKNADGRTIYRHISCEDKNMTKTIICSELNKEGKPIAVHKIVSPMDDFQKEKDRIALKMLVC